MDQPSPMTTPGPAIRLHRFVGAGLAGGTGRGVRVRAGALLLHAPTGRVEDTDPHGAGTAGYVYGTWTSPWVAAAPGATEAVASWTADTPPGTWLAVDLRGSTAAGEATGWYAMARWAAGEQTVRRTSLGGQRDADGHVDTDTVRVAPGREWVAWRLRLRLYRRPAGTGTPRVRSASVMTSGLPADPDPPAPPGRTDAVTLDVPRFPQRVHAGHHPQGEGGGAAGGAPAATAMVLAYWGAGPGPADHAWVGAGHPDPWVDHAARHTYDHGFRGCGNWAFNTAYAGTFGLDGYVTRLAGLPAVERFVAAGVPVVVSAAFTRDQLPGAGYDTRGHLMVVVGFTAGGDPVVNDPSADDAAGVRRVYGRAALEAAWWRGSRGAAYVIHPPGHAVPAG